MKDIPMIINGLKHTPVILQQLIESIPAELIAVRRKKNKWSIHEHLCHLPEAEQMIIERFKAFKEEEHPQFTPYLPGKTVSANHLATLNRGEELKRFVGLRKSLVDLVLSFDESIWLRQASHHEYTAYNAYILLRHTLMHDHFHMYRMEEIWLTRDEYLL